MSDGHGARLHLVEEDAGRPSADDWEVVYRDHVGGVYGFLVARVGNRSDAEDLCAQVFLRALPRLRVGAPPGQIHAYLLTAARTVAADFWRARYALPLAVLDESVLPGHLDAAPGGDHTDRIERLLGGLPERHRRLLELRFLRGYSVKETATALGITTANCKVLQARALRRAAGLEAEEN